MSRFVRIRHAVPAALLLACAGTAGAATPSDELRAEGIRVGLGIGGQFSSVDARGTPGGVDGDAAGVNLALALGYGLNRRTSLSSALHWAHHEGDDDRSRGIGLFGLGVRHRFGADPDGWYVEGLFVRAVVTRPFDDADGLDDDDFATGPGARLALGRGLTPRLRIEGAVLGVRADGGDLPRGADVEAVSTQLQLTYRVL